MLCKAILAGAGSSSGLSVRLCWLESSKRGSPEIGRLQLVSGSGVQPLSRRQAAPTRGQAAGCSNAQPLSRREPAPLVSATLVKRTSRSRPKWGGTPRKSILQWPLLFRWPNPRPLEFPEFRPLLPAAPTKGWRVCPEGSRL